MFKRITAIMLTMIVFLTAVCAGTFHAAEAENSAWSAVERTKELLASTSADAGADADRESIAAEQLPSALDLRDYHGMNYVTPVKQQNPFGTCWAFSIAAAAEISYLYANGLGVPAGTPNENVDFSEKYIAWYIFHGITEDDVSLGRVRSSQVGEGFDVSEAEKSTRNAVYDTGGTSLLGFNLFASGFGPVDERTDVDGAYPYYYSGKERLRSSYSSSYAASDDWTLPVNAAYRNAPTDAFLRNSSVLPSPSVIDENRQYHFNEAGVNAIKAELAKGHGVAAGICVSGAMNTDNWAGYNSSVAAANHDVTIVGYDDNYSKDNFTRYSAAGRVVKNSTPPADGAFIVKNSNGALTDADRVSAVIDDKGRVTYPNPNAAAWGIDDSGYFYLSYYDHSIETPCCFDFDDAGTAAASYTQRNYDQYDLMMTDTIDCNTYDSEAKIANVFEAEEDEYLFRISYMTNLPDTAVSYAVYQGGVDGAPDSGRLLEQGRNTHLYNGVHSVDLQHEYFLKQGERYSVVLTMQTADEDGYLEIIPMFLNPIPGMKNNGVVNAGESYLFSDGGWSDLSALKDDLIDSRYRMIVEMLGSESKVRSVIPYGREGIVIDNYPIKAVLTPAWAHDTLTALGDANLDHEVDTADATWVQRYDAKMLSLSSVALQLSDVDGSGVVSIVDVTWIQRYLIGMKAPEGIGAPYDQEG